MVVQNRYWLSRRFRASNRNGQYFSCEDNAAHRVSERTHYKVLSHTGIGIPDPGPDFKVLYVKVENATKRKKLDRFDV